MIIIQKDIKGIEEEEKEEKEERHHGQNQQGASYLPCSCYYIKAAPRRVLERCIHRLVGYRHPLTQVTSSVLALPLHVNMEFSKEYKAEEEN